ncbi:heme-binding protein [Halorarius litoreus]|uniref:heme-binding protein n=1 Tax=Halorarius litoreus TaxID=2962676 RepID=UPI0020CD9CB4|nr:heme-binding protein [Halorarius litoreus]
MERREPPVTEEGWYALHDLRRIDWDAWRAAPERERERALEGAVEFFEAHEALDDSDEGGSALFSMMGHKADLMVLHLRPSTEQLDRAERAFEQTAFAAFTERATSYVSVTEISGYVTQELEQGIENIESAGTRNYLQQRLHPTIPDAEHVCFYPMDKRREGEDNWYDLPFDERAELISGHGEIGREYAGKVTQIITGSLGFDDYEWGVTLFAADPTEIKHLLYEMRFDPSSSRFAEFGPFYFGRRFAPADLPKLLAGEPLPAYGESDDAAHPHADEGDESSGHPHAEDDEEETSDASTSAGRPPQAQGEAPHDETSTDELEQTLRQVGIDADEYPEAGYGLVVYSDADAEEMVDDVDGLRGNFEHYDTHLLTAIRADAGHTVAVSLWKNERAANTASGFLFDLPGVERGVGAPLGDADAGGDSEVESTDDDADIRAELTDLDIYAGQPHGEDVYAMVLYSEADLDELAAEVSSLADGFDRYDTHVGTSLYRGTQTDRAAVVSLWETADAAETAGGYLSDLPGIVRRAGQGPAEGASGEAASRAGEGSGFGTMGMFYTVKPDHREEFVERFETVGGMLADMEGHHETDLMVNVDDENDMFIASQWGSKDDAMGFFRSDAFRETVQWGRDVLADRPRHVFLA